MRYIQLISNVIRIAVPQSLLKTTVQRNRSQRAILTYHSISEKPVPHSVSANNLRRHLVWAKLHYKLVKLADLVENLQKDTPVPEDLMAVSFDDGYRDFLDNAMPVLADLDVPATLFVPAAKVGGYNDWDAGSSDRTRKPLLTFPELNDIPKKLVDIGSHGLDHQPLDTVSANENERQLAESRSILEQNLQHAVTLFSFPNGRHYDRRKRRGEKLGNRPLEHAGYHAACTTQWGRFNTADTLFSLRRVAIGAGDSIEDFRNKVAGYYDWLVPKEFCARKVRTCLRSSRKSEED